MCKCVLPPGDNPIAVNKYIISSSWHFISTYDYIVFDPTNSTITNKYLSATHVPPTPTRHTGCVHSFYTVKPLQLNRRVHKTKTIQFLLTFEDIPFE